MEEPGSNYERWQRRNALPPIVVTLLVIASLVFGGVFTYLSISGFWNTTFYQNVMS